MRTHFNDNLDRYKTEHPGEYVRLKPLGDDQFQETFYRTQEEVDKAREDFGSACGNFFVEEIPNE